MVSGFVPSWVVRHNAAQFSIFALLLVAWSSALFSACSKSECLPGACAGAEQNQAEAGAAGATESTPRSGPCKANQDCDSASGQACVDGTCRVPCASHFDCQGYGLCQLATDSDGASGLFCSAAQPPKAGQFFAHCPSGKNDECDAANDFFCVSAGPGDLDGYCTTDCTDDSTCAPGFACTKLTRPPCAAVCGLMGNPKDRSCIPVDQVGDDQPYHCSRQGVTRSVCRPREFCSSCQSDADCLAVPGQICARDQSGAKICTQRCDLKHPSCPWGSAASCGVWDQELGTPTCAHRFGQCKGRGRSCEPCLTDDDCGASGACLSSGFTGEHWCVDLSVHCSCAADASSNGLCSGGGCPKSPSGLTMTCVDSTPSAPKSGLCEGADTSSSQLSDSSPQQTGCWPAR